MQAILNLGLENIFQVLDDCLQFGCSKDPGYIKTGLGADSDAQVLELLTSVSAGAFYGSFY